MTEAYLHQVRLSVGPAGLRGLEFQGDFRITFDVTRDTDREPNTASIEITNLSDESRSVVDAEGAIATLSAGYGGEMFSLFTGEVARVEHTPTGTDLVTKLECDDGNREFVAEIDVYEPPGSTFGSVLASIADAVGLPLRVAENQGAALRERLVRGYSFTGPARLALAELLDDAGISWSIQNRVLEVWPDGGAAADVVPFVSSDTGLVGWAIKTRIDLGSRRGRRSERSTAPGVKFQSLLLHNFQPGGRVQLDSEFVSGIYRIQRVRLNGDSYGDMSAAIEAIE